MSLIEPFIELVFFSVKDAQDNLGQELTNLNLNLTEKSVRLLFLLFVNFL